MLKGTTPTQKGDDAMSKQRSIVNHRSDFPLYRAFEIALAQVGFPQTVGQMKYVKIDGNKEDGKVIVSTPLHTARVYMTGKREYFFTIQSITFDVLNGEKLPQPKIVNCDIGDMSLMVLMHRFEKVAPGIIYHLVGTAFNFNTAESVLLHLADPKVLSDGANECVVRYVLDNICGIRTVELQYSQDYGFIEAVINGERYFICEHFTHVWHEHIASEPVVEDCPED
jgi:hypothetical protein